MNYLQINSQSAVRGINDYENNYKMYDEINGPTQE